MQKYNPQISRAFWWRCKIIPTLLLNPHHATENLTTPSSHQPDRSETSKPRHPCPLSKLFVTSTTLCPSEHHGPTATSTAPSHCWSLSWLTTECSWAACLPHPSHQPGWSETSNPRHRLIMPPQLAVRHFNHIVNLPFSILIYIRSAVLWGGGEQMSFFLQQIYPFFPLYCLATLQVSPN